MTTYKPFLQQYRDAIHAAQEQDARIETLQSRIQSLQEEIPAEEKAIIDLESSLKDALLTEAALPANSKLAEGAKKAIEEGKYKEAYQMLGEIKDYILVNESDENYTTSGVANFWLDAASKTGYDGKYALVELFAPAYMQPFGKIWWKWRSFGKFANYHDHFRMEYGQALAAISRIQQEHGSRVRIIWDSSGSKIEENTAETIRALATAGNPVTFFSYVEKGTPSQELEVLLPHAEIYIQGLELLLPHAEIYILDINNWKRVIHQYASHLFKGTEKPTEGLLLSPEQQAEKEARREEEQKEQEAQRQRQQEQEAAQRARQQAENDAELEALLK